MIDLKEELKGIRSAAIAGHVRPDGDCVGSCMGLYLYIKKYFPHVETVDVYLEEFAESFHFIKGTDQVKHSCEEDRSYDRMFCLDAGDAERLGGAVKYLKSAKRSICIDHHISNIGFADENLIVKDASSTSELIYTLLEPDRVTREIAEPLYMGIAHDTGIFQYSCTSPETMRIAGMLMGTGIDFSDIVQKTYFQKTYLQNQILGRALMESILVLDKRCIFSVIRKKDMDFYKASPMDLEGIVSQLRNTEGCLAAIFLYESGPQEFKVSMRSDGAVDVRAVAVYFGGGGHIRAAGCTMQGTAHDVINNLTARIECQLTGEKK